MTKKITQQLAKCKENSPHKGRNAIYQKSGGA